MIEDISFTKERIDSFRKHKEHKRVDPIILEKLIYALHLLESLVNNGLNFVFKGGTSLVLILKEESRFSIDIDMICNTPREELEKILKEIVEDSKFKSFDLDEPRSYKDGVPKAHYYFKFDSSKAK